MNQRSARPAGAHRLPSRRAAAACLVAGLVMASAACSSSGTSASDTAPVSGGSSSETAASASASTDKHLNIGYFAFQVQNSYEAPEIAAAKKAAAAQNASLTVFDANANAQNQYGQLQDAIVSGKFDGFLVEAVDGAGLVPIVKQALAKHIKVVGFNTVLGPDLTKQDPQIPGVSAAVVYTAYDRGQHEGKLVEQACATVSGDCQVGYMYDYKASGFDQGVRSGLDSIIGTNPKIKVVAEGQDSFTASGGLASAQQMLQAHPEIDVFVGSDQGMQGTTQALRAAGKTSQVKIIGLGGSVAGLEEVESGAWFGEVATLPATQATVAVQAITKALRQGVDSGGINPAAGLPDGGLVTKANVDKFTGQWNG